MVRPFVPEEVLFRQIHPHSLEKGEPSSDRFRPYANDQNQMSVDRSALTTAAESHTLYVANGKLSAAVFGLAVAELSAESIPCKADPLTAKDDQLENAAHALADYSAHSEKAQKNIAKKLKQLAIARGCLHSSVEA
ncbi:hypothetical protein H7F36_02875 [Variovorax sp. PAMC28562]|uniref:hypothetical protein n=1 Tax=Variovorax sp. PAMC28562 TaxID=2762323 RepID=UPI00164EB972|nr:hypothetical protein [Variovorax sp. PAMC28562]QNK74208.1 hypothetical protein H7F36_02875 [Variovorax sp. PAMC28562]